MEEKHCKWYNDEFCTNDKSPCVADYCPVVEYPELCKHREVDKDINVRSKTEEKKLTDEEIVKALECCANDEMCRECPYFIKGIDCGEQRSEKDYLDLIHRLQGNYSNLKERYVKVLGLNEKVIAEQKAEIERLNGENGEFFPKIYDFIEVRQKRMVEPYKDALTYILRELKLEFGGEDEAN
jgi:hypothetical protein